VVISTLAALSFIEGKQKKPRRRPSPLIASIPGIVLVETLLLTNVLLSFLPESLPESLWRLIGTGADVLAPVLVVISTFAAVSFIESEAHSSKESN
jgi:hypothetical protein